MLEPIKVFISYSHKDEELRAELMPHFSGLIHSGLIAPWNDRDIEAGTQWANEIDQNLEQAHIILFLVSADFINSRYCRSVEMKRALERYEEKEAHVIPVIIRACEWKSSPLSKLQGIPQDNKPVATRGDRYARDVAWVEIVTAVRGVAQKIYDRLQAEETARTYELGLQEYRQAAEKYYADGILTEGEQDNLDWISQKYQLPTSKVQRILDQVKSRYGQEQENLAQYRRLVQSEIEHYKGLPPEAKATLADVRTFRNIAVPQAEAIEQEILDTWQQKRADQEEVAKREQSLQIEKEQLEQEQQQKLQQEQLEQERQQKLQQDREEIKQKIELKSFSFAVVLLDNKGKAKSRTTETAQYFTQKLPAGVELDMVSIPGGSFQMGSPDGEGYSIEKPQHLVTVPAFFMGKFPITQAQWRAVAKLPKVNRDLEAEPSFHKGDQRPVEKVSWHDAVEFCDRLSHETEQIYRLPSEAEWEYACRAQTTTSYHFGNKISREFVNYNAGNMITFVANWFRQETTEVVVFGCANKFGLFDMHGNVDEWCLDTWHDNYSGAPTDASAWFKNGNDNRLRRGGSWLDSPGDCRSASRFSYSPDNRSSFIGFRVVCVLS